MTTFSELTGIAIDLIRGALFASIAIAPRESALSAAELEEIVVGQRGVGAGAFRKALETFSGDRDGSSPGRYRLASRYLIAAMTNGVPVPDSLRPAPALDAVGAAFDELENAEGDGASLDAGYVASRHPEISVPTIEHALALLVAWGRLSVKNDEYLREGPWPTYVGGSALRIPAPPIVVHAVESMQVVRDVIGGRGGAQSPSSTPEARFEGWLRGGGLSGLAGWWSATVREMLSLRPESHPTAICVLTAALLEAALVAISVPAQAAGQWNHRFLKEKAPDRWYFKQLIDQAFEAGSFNGTHRALAELMAMQRNRIHAGQFLMGGAFTAPFTNAHEAVSARHNLAVLLDAILSWEVTIRPPVL